MLCMTAGRTGKGMTTTNATQAAARTLLAGRARVNLCHDHTPLLRLVGHTFPYQAMLPEAETTAQGNPSYLALLWLWHMQVFKDKYCMCGGKDYQLLSSLLGKGAGTVALCATKPFHDTSDTSGILVLCLTGRMFLLKTGACLGCSSVLDLDALPRNKEGISIGVYRNKGVGFIEVNTNGVDTLGGPERSG